MQEELYEFYKNLLPSAKLCSDEQTYVDWSRYKDGKLLHSKEDFRRRFRRKKANRKTT
jgi:hypothetical protein